MYDFRTGGRVEKGVKAKRKFIGFCFIIFLISCLFSACGTGGASTDQESNGYASVGSDSSGGDSFSDKNSAGDGETTTAEDSGIWTSVHRPE